MIKIIFKLLVGVSLVGVIGVLGAPVPRTRALNVHDGQPRLEVRDFDLVRRGALTKAERNLKRSRRPGFYVRRVRCPNSCRSVLVSPSGVNSHCVQFHDGYLSDSWVEPETIPVPKGWGMRRKYPPGETKRSVDKTAELALKRPTETKRLIAMRKARAERLLTDPAYAAMQQAGRLQDIAQDQGSAASLSGQSKSIVSRVAHSAAPPASPPAQPGPSPSSGKKLKFTRVTQALADNRQGSGANQDISCNHDSGLSTSSSGPSTSGSGPSTSSSDA